MHEFGQELGAGFVGVMIGPKEDLYVLRGNKLPRGFQKVVGLEVG